MKDLQLFPKQCINVQTTERHLFMFEIVKTTLNIFNNKQRSDILCLETFNVGVRDQKGFISHYLSIYLSITITITIYLSLLRSLV